MCVFGGLEETAGEERGHDTLLLLVVCSPQQTGGIICVCGPPGNHWTNSEEIFEHQPCVIPRIKSLGSYFEGKPQSGLLNSHPVRWSHADSPLIRHLQRVKQPYCLSPIVEWDAPSSSSCLDVRPPVQPRDSLKPLRSRVSHHGGPAQEGTWSHESSDLLVL